MPTAFEMRVYEAVSLVPAGKVTTYKHVAEFLGTGAYRAVGQALSRNPFAPRVPCHRVVRSDRRIGGFAGHSSGPAVERKIALLKREGVRISDGRIHPDDVVGIS